MLSWDAGPIISIDRGGKACIHQLFGEFALLQYLGLFSLFRLGISGSGLECDPVVWPFRERWNFHGSFISADRQIELIADEEIGMFRHGREGGTMES